MSLTAPQGSTTLDRIARLSESAAQKPHGTRSRYVAGRCRCDDCRAANNAYQKRRERLKARGQANPIVSAERARYHIHRLSRQGVGYKTVADAASIPNSIALQIRSGARKNVRKQTLDRILSVTKEAAGDAALIDARPAWQIIDGLLERGFTKVQIAEWLGHKSIQFKRDLITVRNAARVRRLAELLDAGKLRRGEPGPSELRSKEAR